MTMEETQAKRPYLVYLFDELFNKDVSIAVDCVQDYKEFMCEIGVAGT